MTITGKKRIWNGIICVLCFMFLFHVSSEAKWIAPAREQTRYKVDLDGNGKKETIIEKNEKLYINGKKALSLEYTEKDSCMFKYWYICDLWKNDNRNEIIVLSYPHRMTVYRYKNKKLVKYASSKKDLFYYVFYDINLNCPGNGTVGISQWLFSHDTYQIIGDVNTILKISDGKIKLSRNVIHDIEFDPDHFNYLKTTGKKTYAYKLPKTGNNKLLFTLKKGVKYKPLRVKFTKKYTFIEIQVRSTKKKGWIGLKNKTINQESLTPYEITGRARNINK